MDTILQLGKREDTVNEDSGVVRYCEDCLCDFGFGIDQCFVPASIFFSIGDVVLRSW